MSQWGEERVFASETATIRVIPDVDTGSPLDPLNLESKVRVLFMIDRRGDEEEGKRLFLEAQRIYIDRPYAEWRRSGNQKSEGSYFHEAIPCKIRQWSDMTDCTTEGCGLRWDTNDDPPRCPRLAVARGRVAPERVYPSTPSPSPHQARSLWAAVIVLAALIAYSLHQEIIGWFR